jgi:hypothetical protein
MRRPVDPAKRRKANQVRVRLRGPFSIQRVAETGNAHPARTDKFAAMRPDIWSSSMR